MWQDDVTMESRRRVEQQQTNTKSSQITPGTTPNRPTCESQCSCCLYRRNDYSHPGDKHDTPRSQDTTCVCITQLNTIDPEVLSQWRQDFLMNPKWPRLSVKGPRNASWPIINLAQLTHDFRPACRKFMHIKIWGWYGRSRQAGVGANISPIFGHEIVIIPIRRDFIFTETDTT